MKKTLTVIAMLLLLGSAGYAQQDPMFTKYMFNSLIFNPAYAGSKDYMTVGLLHRTQWVNFSGAPTTQTVTLHTPLKNERVGVGFSMVNDVIGPTNSFGANFAYAYRIPMGNGKLSIGMQAGIENYRADFSVLDLQEGIDPSFNQTPNLWNPNFGAGIFYYTRNFYAGLSSPQLVEYELAPEDQLGTNAIYARNYRHFYFTTGVAIPIKGDNLIFKPSLLIKNVGVDKQFSNDPAFENIGAPTEFDIDLSLLFQQTFWVGASFRAGVQSFGNEAKTSYDSADIWLSWNMPNGLRIGAAFDYPLTEINTATAGSFEVMLGYDFNYVTKATVTPRYF